MIVVSLVVTLSGLGEWHNQRVIVIIACMRSINGDVDDDDNNDPNGISKG